jgi:hypothetical protein
MSGKEFLEYLLEHTSSFNPESFSWTEELLGKMDKLQETAKKFQTQLQSLFLQAHASDTNQLLQERIKAAAGYFVTETGSLIQFIQQSPAVTDSRMHSKEYNESMREIFAQLAMKKFMYEGLKDGFEIESFHQRRQKFILPSISVNAYAGANQKRVDSPHPVLHQQLRKMRDSICSRKDIPIYIVAGSSTIDEMAMYLPHTLTELRKISGFGDAKIRQYGQQFLDVITAYCVENDLSSQIHLKSPKRERKDKPVEKDGKSTVPKKKGDTHAETFKLYKEGKTVSDIAKERSLAVSTIEGHLCKFIRRRDISINELVSREKFVLIEAALKDFDGTSTGPVKQKLPNDISFGEIKMVMASLGITQHHSGEIK